VDDWSEDAVRDDAPPPAPEQEERLQADATATARKRNARSAVAALTDRAAAELS
jgi:hypothetical protein